MAVRAAAKGEHGRKHRHHYIYGKAHLLCLEVEPNRKRVENSQSAVSKPESLAENALGIHGGQLLYMLTRSFIPSFCMCVQNKNHLNDFLRIFFFYWNKMLAMPVAWSSWSHSCCICVSQYVQAEGQWANEEAIHAEFLCWCVWRENASWSHQNLDWSGGRVGLAKLFQGSFSPEKLSRTHPGSQKPQRMLMVMAVVGATVFRL